MSLLRSIVSGLRSLFRKQQVDRELDQELHAYLAATRQKCDAQLFALTDERARQVVEYPWAEEQAVSFLELQLYNMRHVQEHAAQLSLFLGQHAIPEEAFDWVPRAKDEPGS